MDASLGVFFFPVAGPALPVGNVAVPPSCEPTNPGAVGCTPASGAIAGERAYGPFWLFSPLVSAGYTF